MRLPLHPVSVASRRFPLRVLLKTFVRNCSGSPPEKMKNKRDAIGFSVEWHETRTINFNLFPNSFCSFFLPRYFDRTAVTWPSGNVAFCLPRQIASFFRTKPISFVFTRTVIWKKKKSCKIYSVTIHGSQTSTGVRSDRLCLIRKTRTTVFHRAFSIRIPLFRSEIYKKNNRKCFNTPICWPYVFWYGPEGVSTETFILRPAPNTHKLHKFKASFFAH